MTRLYKILISLSILAINNARAASPCVTVNSVKYMLHEAQTPQALPQAAKFIPTFDKRSFSTTNKALWLQYQIQVQDCAEAIFWQSPNLDIAEIKFWQIQEGQQLANDQHLLSDSHRHFPQRNWPTFKLDNRLGEHTILMRFKSDYSIKMQHQFTSQAERVKDEITRQALYLIFLGLCAALSLYNLYLYARVLDKTYMYYVAFVGSIVLATGINSGNLNWLFPRENSWQPFLHSAVALVVYLRVACVRSMLPLQMQTPKADLFLKYLGWAALSIGLIDWLPGVRSALQPWMGLYLFIVTGICLGAACLSFVQQYKPAKYMITAWSASLVLMVLGLLQTLGHIPNNLLIEHAFELSVAIELILLAMILAEQINTLQKELTRLNKTVDTRVETRTKELKEANKKHQENQAHVIEHEKFAALGRIADALAHEVNTPLMIIRTGAGILARGKSIGDDMIVKRTEQIERAVDKIEKIVNALTITYLNPVTESGQKVSIRGFIQSIVNLHQGLCVQHEIKLETIIPNDINIPGNPLHLADIISEIFIASINSVAGLPEKWIEINVNRAKNDIIITLKDSCTDTDGDQRCQLFGTINELNTDLKSDNGKDKEITVGVAKQVIKSYGGSMKFIQNNFYSITTIKFPIDVENNKKRTAA